MIGRPVARELLHRRQLHALRRVVDELFLRPAGCGDAAAEVVQILVRNIYVKGADCAAFGLRLIGDGRWSRG